jgi:hypothetical protein
MPALSLTRRSAFLTLAGASLLTCRSALAAEGLPKMVVTKDPTCGCCSGWVEHIRAAGFEVEVLETTQVNRVKTRLRVPRDLASCHTAEVGGFVIEGHVPASAVRRLLSENPQAVGLAVPGMPVGSPGMEVEGTTPEVYEVVLFGSFGQRVFARFRGGQQI